MNWLVPLTDYERSMIRDAIQACDWEPDLELLLLGPNDRASYIDFIVMQLRLSR